MSLEEPVFVSSVEELCPLKKYQKIQFYCKNCGKLTERLYVKSRLEIIKRFYCADCNTKKNNLEKYGYENVAQVPEIKEKFQKTNLKRYGNICSLNGKEQVEKKKETWLKKFGAINPFQKKEIKDKVKQNNLKKYGVPYAFTTKEAKENNFKSQLLKYGKIGGGKIQYLLDDIIFDSSWEVAFYLYNRDLGKNIKRNDKTFKYIFEEKEHITFVDFDIDGELFEVKGNHLLKKEIQKAKIKVLKENNVKILSKEEIKPYLKYMKENYPKDFLDNIKICKK